MKVLDDYAECCVECQYRFCVFNVDFQCNEDNMSRKSTIKISEQRYLNN